MLCNISIVGAEQIEVESESMCNYVNYHVVMFVVCGVFSLIMMLVACVCPGPEAERGGCVIWALVFFFLMAGFEGSIVLLIALEYLVMLFVIISKLSQYFRRRPATKVHPIPAAAVVEEVVNVVGIPLSPGGTQAAQAAVEIVPASVVVVENSSSCCGI
jgi:hypothetical protein